MAGSLGAPRRYWTHDAAFEQWHYWSSVDPWFWDSVFLALLCHDSFSFKGKKAPKNPWGAVSLEWETATPPIEHNFHGQVICDKGPYDFPEIEQGV